MPSGRHKRAVPVNDHDQARREDRKPKLAVSRTEQSGYSQMETVSKSDRAGHASLNVALASRFAAGLNHKRSPPGGARGRENAPKNPPPLFISIWGGK